MGVCECDVCAFLWGTCMHAQVMGVLNLGLLKRNKQNFTGMVQMRVLFTMLPLRTAHTHSLLIFILCIRKHSEVSSNTLMDGDLTLVPHHLIWADGIGRAPAAHQSQLWWSFQNTHVSGARKLHLMGLDSLMPLPGRAKNSDFWSPWPWPA